MARELKNAKITHVSYVDKAANKKQFFLTKSAEDQPVFEKTVKLLTKADDAQQLVYGIVYEPDTVDAHGDMMTAESIEKAAHGFMKDYQNIDTQHDFVDGAGEVVESYVAPADFEIGGQTIVKGSWVLVTKATDEIWDKIQKGEITGYSMAGTAEVEAEKKVSKAQQLVNLMKELIGIDLSKGEVKDKFYGNKKYREFWDALYIFEDVFYSEIWKEGSLDTNRVKEAAMDFAELLQEIASSDDDTILKALTITKAGKKISTARLSELKSAHDILGKVISDADDATEEEVDVTKEELATLLKEELAPITDRIAKLENPEPAPAATEPTPEDVAKAEATKNEMKELFKSAVAEAVQPLADRLEAVEKARGFKKSEDDDTQQVVSKSEGVFDSLFSVK